MLGRPFLNAFGWFFLGIGIVGIFVPLLPTTPFVILAAYCFSKSSRRTHDWLENHPYLGPPLRDWNRRGVIRTRVKWTASFLIVLSMGYAILFFITLTVLKIVATTIGLSILIFIWSRPSKSKTHLT